MTHSPWSRHIFASFLSSNATTSWVCLLCLVSQYNIRHPKARRNAVQRGSICDQRLQEDRGHSYQHSWRTAMAIIGTTKVTDLAVYHVQNTSSKNLHPLFGLHSQAVNSNQTISSLAIQNHKHKLKCLQIQLFSTNSCRMELSSMSYVKLWTISKICNEYIMWLTMLNSTCATSHLS